MDPFQAVVSELNRPTTLARLATGVFYAYSGDLNAIEQEFLDLDPVHSSVITYGAGAVDKLVSLWTPGCVLLFWPGLLSVGDLIEAYLRSNQITTVSVPGGCNRLPGENALAAAPLILADIAAACEFFEVDQIDLVVCGHSQGGANGLCFFAMTDDAARVKIDRVQMVSFQSPRSLSPSAANALSIPHLRLTMRGDLVAHVPPNLWTNNYPPFLVIPPLPLFYQHHGTGVEMDRDGMARLLNFDGPSLDFGLYKIIKGILTAVAHSNVHDLSTMVSVLASLGDDTLSFIPPDNRAFVPNSLGGSSAMATYKLTYFFKQGPWGWSETYFVVADSLTIAQGKAVDNSVVNSRVGMLGAATIANAFNPYMSAVRISNIASSRDSLLVYINKYGTFSVSGYSDTPNTAILCGIRGKAVGDTDEKYRRNLYLRGNPDTLVHNGGQFNPDAAWVLAFNTWFNNVKNAGFGMMSKNITNPIRVNLNIFNSTNDVTVETVTAHGFVTGDIVQIKGVLPKGQLDGDFRIVYHNATQFKILGVNIVGTLSWFGTSQLRSNFFVPFSSAQPARVGHRDTGRPFDSPRGRQPTR